MQITKGFKYRIYPNLEQQKLLNHQFFIYNQAYNIILDLQKKQMQINKNLDKSQRTYLTAVQLDNKVKEILRQRELAFKSVVTQQARINLLRALKDKTKGFPKFKNSKFAKQALIGIIKVIKSKIVIIQNLKYFIL